MIDERPKVVDEKSRIGDWVLDTIIGKNQQQAVLSAVERVSKFTLLKKLTRKTSQLTTKAIVDSLTEYKPFVHTLTSDNGREFAGHEAVAANFKRIFSSLILIPLGSEV